MLTFGLYTQVSNSGSHGPLVNIFFSFDIFLFISLPGRSPGRGIALPPASALALASAAAFLR